MFSLKGQSAVVTGSSRGIGKAIARAFAEAGASVVISSRHLADCEKTARELGNSAFAIQCDASKKEDMELLVSSVVKKFGKLDIFVNNAGIYETKPVQDFTNGLFDRVVDANLRSQFLGVKCAVGEMKKQKYGRIINIASIEGIVGFAGDSVYASTKAAIIQLTKVAALECADYGITVNAIAPGLIDTEMTHDFIANDATMAQKFQPIKRIGQPEDIAACAIYLASREASFITGQSIAVDGGYTVQ